MLNYYNSIDNLSRGLFEKIAETGSLQWLKHYEDDYVDEYKLELAYHKIITEYRDATIKMGNNSLVLQVKNQILALKIKHDIIKLACFNLNMCYNEESIEVLKSHGYTISDDRSIAEQLHEIAHKSSNLQTKWQQKEADLSQFEAPKSDITFDQYVWRLSDKKGYMLDPDTMSVRKWLAMEYNMIIDEKNKKQ